MEPHFLTPFIHWLPLSIRPFYARWFSVWGWINRPSQEMTKEFVVGTKLLTKSQFQELFSDCEIITEKLFGLIPKSYIAYRVSAKQEAHDFVNKDGKTIPLQISSELI